LLALIATTSCQSVNVFAQSTSGVSDRTNLSAPSDRLNELKAEYAQARSKFQSALAGKQTEADRKSIAAQMQREQASFSERFLELARDSNDRQTALSALVWIVSNDFKGSQQSTQALELLIKDYPTDPALVDVGRILVDWAPLDTAEDFLTAAAKSENRQVRGNSLYHLALFLRASADLSRVLKDRAQTERRKLAENVFGRDVVDQIVRQDPADLEVRSESLLNQVAGEYGDVPSFRGSLADVAKRELFEIKNLVVGLPAPEITGVDLDGQSMKLSDYRGKVVMLTFWASWCPPCMGMVPHERAIAQTLAERPFALVGVNSDDELSSAQQAATTEAMSWRSWFDGNRVTGKIAGEWNITQWPTIYVLDQEGVIRFKSRGVPAGGLAQAVAPVIDGLLNDLQASGGSRTRAWILFGAGLLCVLFVFVRMLVGRTPGAANI
jgi:thiol-disulfide isomerase/thioredoxin